MLLVPKLTNTKCDKKQQVKMTETLAHTLALILEYSARAFQLIPTWQGLTGFQKPLCPCALNEISLRIGRVKPIQTS